jgi:hypothetical protein
MELEIGPPLPPAEPELFLAVREPGGCSFVLCSVSGPSVQPMAFRSLQELIGYHPREMESLVAQGFEVGAVSAPAAELGWRAGYNLSSVRNGAAMLEVELPDWVWAAARKVHGGN